MLFLRQYRFCILTFLLLAFGASDAWAVPASPFPFVVEQPDGARITLYTRGDESQHWVENPEGELSSYLVYGQRKRRGVSCRLG